MLRAQDPLRSSAPSPAAICPGTFPNGFFDIAGTQEQAYAAFVVQLSSGNGFRTIPSVILSNLGRYGAQVRATVPADIPAGTYKVRLVGTRDTTLVSNITELTVKAKPAPPSVTAESEVCQRPMGSNITSFTVPVKLSSPEAIPRLYDSNGNTVGSLTPYGTATDKSFEIYSGNEIPGQRTFFATQQINGCESDRAQARITVKPRPSSSINVDNIVGVGNGAVYGIIDYCQGDKALPLNEKGHKPLTDGSIVLYSKDVFGLGGESKPPTPSTDQVGSIQFALSHYLNGCRASLQPTAYITVKINARPEKPTVSTNTVTVCQFQTAGGLSAQTNADGASLVWYGTNATGGTGSAQAPVPSTGSAGTFTYYVAQKVNDCEGERAAITVEVKAASPAPTVSAVSYCLGASASPLSAIAASGGTLNWYAAATGGTGSPAAPSPVTTSTGQQTYYVSQTVSGSCESPRVALPVTVYGIPPAPRVSTAEVSLCQFSASQTLTATGENLKWYEQSSGGEARGSITLTTDAPGTRSYYVSQTVNTCESARTGVSVTIKEAPTAPAVQKTAYSFCFGDPGAVIRTEVAVQSGTYTWYGVGNGQPTLTDVNNGERLLSARVPATQTGTFTYWLTRTVNGCESVASEKMSVTIHAIPAAPGVGPVAICQNTAAPTLQATGENLRWYTRDSSATGSATPPVISTGQASQMTFYVTQTINNCESARATLSVTVYPIPAAPGVASNGSAYCQNAQAQPLQATGQGLTWYRESGTRIGETAIPETNSPGRFTYRVSQTINGCESPRSDLTVTVTALPEAPAVTSLVSYCQQAAASALTASGNELRWYDMNGNGSSQAPTPSTENPGTTTYSVSRTAGGCESPRAEIRVVVKPTPSSPATAPLAVCLNEPARTVSAGGQNLLWYTTEAGGSGSTAAPTVTTGQANQTTFFVTQTIDGCEGPRAALVVTVKPLPAPPEVSPRTICQFAPGETVTAKGENLAWYNPDGNRFTMPPTISTSQGATFTYQVTQTVNGCEGPKATLTVRILTTPAPTVAATTVELCQGATAQPLEASGRNLKWIDPKGVVSTSAPVPPTTSPTASAEGDIYYVTQTDTNTCESPRTAIRVFVQTTPTLSIGGTTAVNLGIEVPLKLAFTGVGPYRYRLSNGLAGTATKDTTLLVLPERTTTYRVAEVSNKCGLGQPGGASATITVAIPEIQTLDLAASSVCAGTSVSTGFTTTGVFNPGSVFRLQIARVEADSTKNDFITIGNQTINGQISGVIPTSIAAGTYRVRVMATNPKIPINGTYSPSLLTVRARATATMTGNRTIFEGESANLSVAFTGDAPWVFTYQDTTGGVLGSPKTVQTASNPHTLTVMPARTATYFLTAVSNVCGNVTPPHKTVLITVAPLLSIDDQSLASVVEVYPIPATTTLTVRIHGLPSSQTARLELVDLTGRSTWQHETRRDAALVPLDQQPAGTYILRIRVGDRMASKRITKL
ncbi:T9SS type A sorting domain-containing protein [Spirosoma sordidisoli]|uniref:T9SS type A sorting domain-containing protein n=1 Tax=Spirosoma sordidisoli TaxID=2502893 RepID=A0A4Q2URI6_9BACT|nr:T9SS type A sorting domain-containing protein [Spirosoma sordidisoli]